MQEWQAFYELEPWGGRQEDLRAAMICHVQSAAWGGKPTPPEQFFPSLRKPRKPKAQTWQEQAAILEALAKVSNNPGPR